MGDKTAIEWTDATWNPLIGCSRVGEGCDHCYAIGVVHRAMSPQHVGLTVKARGAPADWTGEVRPVPHLFDQPTRWRRPRRIFVNSLSDLFHPEALKLLHTDGNGHRAPLLAHLVAEMVANDRHTFQVLTKRPQIMAAVLASPMFRLDVNSLVLARGHSVMPGGMSEPDMPWPRHIWWGTSIELDKYAFRADYLRSINGVRWVSAEPLLGPLPSLDLTGIDWIVAGGESGPGARPMHPEWVRDLRDRCTTRVRRRAMATSEIPGHALNDGCTEGVAIEPDPVAFLFKQWGQYRPVPIVDDPTFVGGRAFEVSASSRYAAVIHERSTGAFESGEVRPMEPGDVTGVGVMLDRDTMALSVGKKAAGRELDGRTWDEYPAAKS